jgi:hypothetical protein
MQDPGPSAHVCLLRDFIAHLSDLRLDSAQLLSRSRSPSPARDPALLKKLGAVAGRVLERKK